MKSISGKNLCRNIGKERLALKTIRGSHHVYMKPERKERISVPVHSNKDLKLGLLKAIMKIAEIQENELRQRLIIGQSSEKIIREREYHEVCMRMHLAQRSRTKSPLAKGRR